MKKIDFLYNSINDAREIIKMMDLKANFLIFFVVVMIGGLLKNECNNVLKFITIVWGLGIIIYLFFYVIRARFNPEEKIVNIELEKDYRFLFFPIYKRDYKEYKENFESLDDSRLEDVLILERLKLQTIIDDKVDNFNMSVKFLFLFFVFLFILCIS